MSALATVGGLATGVAIGLGGLTAVSAGLLAYAIAAGLVQISGGVNSGPLVLGVWGVVLTGTEIALGASVWLLLGAGARQMVRRRRGSNAPGTPTAGPGAAECVVPGSTSTRSGSSTGRGVVYWLLAVLIFPALNLVLVFPISRSLGSGVLLLWIPLLIAGESVSLRRLVRTQARGPRPLGVVATAGLVLATTIVWSLVLFLIALSQVSFTF